MKKIVALLVFLSFFFSCKKEEAVQKPAHLIGKSKMIDVLYDLSLLEAVNQGHLASTMNYKVNPKEYIYKKYKVDSAQFSQSNIYYAANYVEYQDMLNLVTKRIDSKKVVVDSLYKIQKKQDSIVNARKRKQDSIKRANKPLTREDSLVLIRRKVDQKRNSLINLRNKERNSLLKRSVSEMR